LVRRAESDVRHAGSMDDLTKRRQLGERCLTHWNSHFCQSAFLETLLSLVALVSSKTFTSRNPSDHIRPFRSTVEELTIAHRTSRRRFLLRQAILRPKRCNPRSLKRTIAHSSRGSRVLDVLGRGLIRQRFFASFGVVGSYGPVSSGKTFAAITVSGDAAVERSVDCEAD
jgi:hypothetical protein